MRDPLSVSPPLSESINSRISENEVASNKHFGDIQLLVLGAWRKCLPKYLRLRRKRILGIILEVLLICLFHQLDDFLDLLRVDRLKRLIDESSGFIIP